MTSIRQLGVFVDGGSVEEYCSGYCMLLDGLCLGCGLTKAEAEGWSKLGLDEKLKVGDLARDRIRCLADGRQVSY